MKKMSNGVRSIARLLLCVLFLLSLSTESVAQDGFKLTEEQAKEEVRIVVENLLRYHPDPFHVTSKELFYENVEQLLARKGDIALVSQYFDLSQLLSLVFDVHTQLHITEETPGFGSTFPLRFRIFPDGRYISAGRADYRRGIGTKVLSISGKSVPDVINLLSRFSSADSSVRKRVQTEALLYLPETYDYFDLMTAEGQIELVVQDPNGGRSNLEISKTWDKGVADFSWDSLNPFTPEELLSVHDVLGTEQPLLLENLGDNYWYGFIDEHEKFMYLQINLPSRKEDGPLPTDFHLNWSQDLWKSKAEVLIIDLRTDPGGSISLGNPIPGILSTLFHEHPTLRGVAVLMGTDTVSAGVILAAQLEDAIAPIFIGAPSGSAPNIFLQATKMDLPHSKFRFEVSTDKYIVTRELDTRRYMAPDIPMALSFDDYATGRDPLIEFAKTIDKKMRRDIYRTASVYQPWFRETQKKAFE
jgi:hypothetical protein